MEINLSVEKLRTIYNSLIECNLANGIHNESSLSEFKDLLNSSIPTTDAEVAVGEFIRYLHRLNKNSLMRYLQINNLYHLILYTDGYPISKVLQIDDIICVKWNKQKKLFDATFIKKQMKEPALQRHKNQKPVKLTNHGVVHNTSVYESLNTTSLDNLSTPSPKKSWFEIMEEEEQKNK